jgi:hypothetical protein
MERAAESKLDEPLIPSAGLVQGVTENIEETLAWQAEMREQGYTLYYCGEPEDKFGPAPSESA